MRLLPYPRERMIRRAWTTAALALIAEVEIAVERLRIRPTGRGFAMHGDPPAQAGSAGRGPGVHACSDPAQTALDVEE